MTDERFVTAAELSPLLPPRKRDTHKGDYGYVALLGGCIEYSGAIRLAAMAQAAHRCGCGVATVALPRSLAAAAMPCLLEGTLCRMPEVDGHLRFDPDALDALVSGRRAVAVGMGLGRHEDGVRIVEWLLSHYGGTLLIDADGLWALAQLGVDRLSAAACRVILTPHRGEFSRLTGLSVERIAEAPTEEARRFAAATNTIVLLKGAVTAVTDGSETRLVDRGTPGMATAGSGDVLSGALVGLFGYLSPNVRTVALGAYLAGLAGELAARTVGEVSMLASDTVAHLAEAVRIVQNGGAGQ